MIYDLPSTRSVCFHVNGAMAAGRLLHRRKFQHSFARRIACRRPNSAGANRGTLHDAHGTRSPGKLRPWSRLVRLHCLASRTSLRCSSVGLAHW